MAQSTDADAAIVGARIRTLDDAHPTASALAWRDGVLVAVGSDATSSRMSGRARA